MGIWNAKPEAKKPNMTNDVVAGAGAMVLATLVIRLLDTGMESVGSWWTARQALAAAEEAVKAAEAAEAGESVDAGSVSADALAAMVAFLKEAGVKGTHKMKPETVLTKFQETKSAASPAA